MGMGFYMLHNTLQTNATQMAPERRGTAVSQFAASLFIGQSVGVAIAGIVAQTFDTGVVLTLRRGGRARWSPSRSLLAAGTARAAVAGFAMIGIATDNPGSVHTPDGFVPCARPALVAGGDGARVRVQRRQDASSAATEGAPAIPTLDELAAAEIDGARHYLGELSRRALRRDRALPNDFAPAAWFRLAGLRALFFRVPESLVAHRPRARSRSVEWDRTHRYLRPLRNADARQGEASARRNARRAGYVAYPRVSPAMMALVTRGRELLLARAHRFPPAMYSALAGFVEPGETIEDCVRREVKEEVGVDVGTLTYFASQSWAFPHSLMIAYTAEYAGGELVPDGEEIADVRWFPADALPDMPPSLSIARRLIDATAARLRAC